MSTYCVVHCCSSGFTPRDARRPTATDIATGRGTLRPWLSPTADVKGNEYSQESLPMHPFYEKQADERAVRIRQERAVTAGYLDAACGEPRRDALADVAESYARGYEQGSLARTMAAMKAIGVAFHVEVA